MPAREIDSQDDIATHPGSDEIEVDLPEERARTQTMIVETRTTLRVRRVRLCAVSGPDQGRELVTERERIRIGSHPTCDLVLNDRTVSRQHAEIQFTDKGYLVVDLESTNGTFLEGRRIERAYLAPGAALKVGGTVISFNAVDEEIAVEADREGRLGEMIGRSVRMRQIFGLIKKIAPMDVTVMITGETGTGKELVARALHDLSARRKGPFVVLDCGAIPANLIESELFGHEKGAFTGADRSRPGAFERANGGTIFLDELGELSLELQPRLLRALENREVRRVGSNSVREVDVRVVAATNRDLQREIQAGNFREDLFFRLSVINIALPALRERREDIPPIVRRLLEDSTPATSSVKRFTEEAMSLLMTYDWPGNVRELVNVVQHVLTFADEDLLGASDLPSRFHEEQGGERGLMVDDNLSFKEAKEHLLEAFEREYIANVLRQCDGNISEAARRSGLHRKSIERLAKKYDLDAKALLK
ncbi:MAG: sigma 54-interacting transcriptional regulator [Myxococcota bacterium]